MKKLIFILFIFIICSCKKDTDISIIPYEVKADVDRFASEANKRGISFQFKGLKIILQNTPPVTGRAGAYFPDENCIRIDTTSNNYKFSNQSKECIIFHELGHAILKRSHRDDFLDAFDDPSSIMNCCNVADYSNINLYKRDYYLNELFNQSTPKPSWAH